MMKVFLARPSYGGFEPEADHASKHGVVERDDIEVHSAAFRKSMTCLNFNDHLATCLNLGGYDYFAMQHADVAPKDGFIEAMIETVEQLDVDITHCPCAHKNDSGKTTTALGYGENIFGNNRLITTTELQSMPDHFDLDWIVRGFDVSAVRLLPNTGCMLLRLGEWINKFPGFRMVDEFGRTQDGTWIARSVSEDYWLGHWAALNGVRVGVTNWPTKHWGRKYYDTAYGWGQERDEEYFRRKELLVAVA